MNRSFNLCFCLRDGGLWSLAHPWFYVLHLRFPISAYAFGWSVVSDWFAAVTLWLVWSRVKPPMSFTSSFSCDTWSDYDFYERRRVGFIIYYMDYIMLLFIICYMDCFMFLLYNMLHRIMLHGLYYAFVYNTLHGLCYASIYNMLHGLFYAT